MQREEFNALVEKAKENHPRWFELERDGPASDQEIAEAERLLGVELPDEYRSFLRDHGGGYFAFAFVFGVAATSDWFVVEKNRARASAFLAISDPGTGDVYGFCLTDEHRCSREISVLDHETNTIKEAAYADLYEMLVVHALQA